jgi:hypothetical protein
MQIINTNAKAAAIDPYSLANAGLFDAYKAGVERQRTDDQALATELQRQWDAAWGNRIHLLMNLRDDIPEEAAAKAQAIAGLDAAIAAQFRASGRADVTPEQIAAARNARLAQAAALSAPEQQQQAWMTQMRQSLGMPPVPSTGAPPGIGVAPDEQPTQPGAWVAPQGGSAPVAVPQTPAPQTPAPTQTSGLSEGMPTAKPAQWEIDMQHGFYNPSPPARVTDPVPLIGGEPSQVMLTPEKLREIGAQVRSLPTEEILRLLSPEGRKTLPSVHAQTMLELELENRGLDVGAVNTALETLPLDFVVQTIKDANDPRVAAAAVEGQTIPLNPAIAAEGAKLGIAESTAAAQGGVRPPVDLHQTEALPPEVSSPETPVEQLSDAQLIALEYTTKDPRYKAEILKRQAAKSAAAKETPKAVAPATAPISSTKAPSQALKEPAAPATRVFDFSRMDDKEVEDFYNDAAGRLDNEAANAAWSELEARTNAKFGGQSAAPSLQGFRVAEASPASDLGRGLGISPASAAAVRLANEAQMLMTSRGRSFVDLYADGDPAAVRIATEARNLLPKGGIEAQFAGPLEDLLTSISSVPRRATTGLGMSFGTSAPKSPEQVLQERVNEEHRKSTFTNPAYDSKKAFAPTDPGEDFLSYDERHDLILSQAGSMLRAYKETHPENRQTFKANEATRIADLKAKGLTTAAKAAEEGLRQITMFEELEVKSEGQRKAGALRLRASIGRIANDVDRIAKGIAKGASDTWVRAGTVALLNELDMAKEAAAYASGVQPMTDAKAAEVTRRILAMSPEELAINGFSDAATVASSWRNQQSQSQTSRQNMIDSLQAQVKIEGIKAQEAVMKAQISAEADVQKAGIAAQKALGEKEIEQHTKVLEDASALLMGNAKDKAEAAKIAWESFAGQGKNKDLNLVELFKKSSNAAMLWERMQWLSTGIPLSIDNKGNPIDQRTIPGFALEEWKYQRGLFDGDLSVPEAAAKTELFYSQPATETTTDGGPTIGSPDDLLGKAGGPGANTSQGGTTPGGDYSTGWSVTDLVTGL